VSENKAITSTILSVIAVFLCLSVTFVILDTHQPDSLATIWPYNWDPSPFRAGP
jgi:hypothetical protein